MSSNLNAHNHLTISTYVSSKTMLAKVLCKNEMRTAAEREVAEKTTVEKLKNEFNKKWKKMKLKGKKQQLIDLVFDSRFQLWL